MDNNGIENQKVAIISKNGKLLLVVKSPKDDIQILKPLGDKESVKIIRGEEFYSIFSLENGFQLVDGFHGEDEPFAADHPILLDIGIMGNCHNKCKVCYQGNVNQPHMTLKNFKSIIDRAGDKINQVALGGRGDPNKHPNFKEIVEYCVANRVMVNYTTSGRGITAEEIKISTQCGSVAVSDYKEEFTYNTIIKLMAANIKTNIQYVVSNESYPEALSIMLGQDVWGNKFPLQRLHAIIFLLFKPQGRGKDFPNLVLPEQREEAFAELSKNPTCKFDVGFDACFINVLSRYRELTPQELVFSSTCDGAKYSGYISPDMKFMPCSFGDPNRGVSIKKGPLDILFGNKIQVAWDTSEYFLEFRNKLKITNNECPVNF